MKVKFESGNTVDIHDDDALMAECNAMAARDVKKVPMHERAGVLRDVISVLHFWHVKNGAQCALALGTDTYVPIEAALDAHNFIGEKLLGKPPLGIDNVIVEGKPATDEEVAEAGPNDHVEGADA